MYDPDRYRAKEEIARWKQRDPLTALAARLEQEGTLDSAVRELLEREVSEQIAAAVSEAETGPLEPVSDLTRDVYTREVR